MSYSKIGFGVQNQSEQNGQEVQGLFAHVCPERACGLDHMPYFKIGFGAQKQSEQNAREVFGFFRARVSGASVWPRSLERI